MAQKWAELFFGYAKTSGARSLFLLGLLGEEHSLDVGEYTSLGNGDTGEKLVQFLVIADGELEMSGDDPGLLVVTGSITCKFQHFSSQVLHDGSQVHGGTSTDALSIVSLAEESVDSSYWELKSGPGATGL